MKLYVHSICLSYSGDQCALLSFCTDSDMAEWRQNTKSWEWGCWLVCRICLAKVSGHSLSGTECVNSAFWSQSVIERLLVWRTAEGLMLDQSPLSGLSGHFTCGWARVGHSQERWRKKVWKVLRRMLDMLMIFWSHQCSINFTSSKNWSGACVLGNTAFSRSKSCACWIAPAVYARIICLSLWGKNNNIKSDNLKQHCPTNDPQLGQPSWFTPTSMPTE